VSRAADDDRQRSHVGRLTDKLQEAVKKLSYKTTVDHLKKKGIQKVNVVGLDRIVALIEAAVHRTLRAQMAGLGGIEKRGEIAFATREEFLKLLSSNETLEREHEEVVKEKDALEGQVTTLRRELGTVQATLAEREARVQSEERVRAAADDAALTREVDGLLERTGRKDDAAVRRLTDDLLALFHARLTEERKRVTEARRKESQNEVELLNRRLTKLSMALQESEAELERVANAKQVDDGVASVFKDVQGLSPGDSRFQQKKGLMSSIFEANQKLRGS
jgi:hypothetical protein